MTWWTVALLQVTSGADWKLITALLTSNAALVSVIGILWWRYNQARDKYEELMHRDRDELVPEMVKMAQVATLLSENAEKLLEESIKLRTYRRGRHYPHAEGSGEPTS